ncbi:MAG: amidohydrolase family protein [Acidobacteria bacterium]|nr:amidohydrolase family protein [Acidobacteriota bacterium]
MKILTADHVLPITGDALERGAVAVDGERIAAVGPRAAIIENYPAAPVEDFGAAAILPGFVNVHSHLEITAMRGFLDEFDADFAAWLLTLTKTRAERLSDDDVQTAAVAGAVEGARAGVTCFGDIGRLGRHGFEALKRAGLRGIVFQETEFSPADRTADEDFEKLREKFLALREGETALVKTGLSPHSPYTVGPRLFQKIAEYAIETNVKITIHAAESREEEEFMRAGTGFFAALYRKFGHEWNAPRCSSVEYLERLGVLRARPLLAHCVTVSDRDLEIIKETDSRVAHCPKSNAKFGHGIAPFERFLDAGIRTGFGSDSVASNNTCDILEEARFATVFARSAADRQRFLHAREIVETATLGGARALGLDAEIGSLEAGKQADLAVVGLDDIAQLPVHDPYAALVFASNARDVRLTMVAGREIYRDGAVTTLDEPALKAKMRALARQIKT